MSAHLAGLLILVRADVVSRLKAIGHHGAGDIAAYASLPESWRVATELVASTEANSTGVYLCGAMDRLAEQDIAGAVDCLRKIDGENASQWEVRVRRLVPDASNRKR